jgi:hypothetical protein
MLYAVWHVLKTVAMAADKHATAANATVVFSLGSVPVMTSYNNRGIGGGVFFVVCSRAV